MECTQEGILAQKAAGDDAFRAGDLHRALEYYSAALQEDPAHVPTLCNRSLTALKLGLPEDALQDAEAALSALSASGAPQPAPTQLAKAIHRKAEALSALGQLLECLKTYRQGLVACPGSPELHAALRLAAEELPVQWLAKYWARHVEAAQAPNPLSSRDGLLLRMVPGERRMPAPDLAAHLQAALYPLQDEARDLLCNAWAEARRPGRAEAAFMRAAAYLNSGNAAQAVKDVRVALVYGPQLPEPDSFMGGDANTKAEADSSGGKAVAQSGKAGQLVKAKNGQATTPAPEPPPAPAAETAGRRSAWPAALGLLGAALEALADNVPAALAVQRAVELDPENEELAETLSRLLRRIPDTCAAALQAGGAAGLEAHLAAEREAALPEFRRQRPKYYYYYEWMKKRILERYPALPEPVMDKLLALEANELDMVLQYPRATQITVERLMAVYEREGAEKLEGYEVPLLSWQDYQDIKERGGAALALPPGDAGAAGTAGRLLEGSAEGAGTAEADAPMHGREGTQAAVVPAQADAVAAGSDAAVAQEMRGVTDPAGGSVQSSTPSSMADGDNTDAASEAASEPGSVDIDELFELD